MPGVRGKETTISSQQPGGPSEPSTRSLHTLVQNSPGLPIVPAIKPSPPVDSSPVSLALAPASAPAGSLPSGASALVVPSGARAPAEFSVVGLSSSSGSQPESWEWGSGPSLYLPLSCLRWTHPLTVTLAPWKPRPREGLHPQTPAPVLCLPPPRLRAPLLPWVCGGASTSSGSSIPVPRARKFKVISEVLKR